MGILKAYTRAHAHLIKSTVGLATEQDFPVMRALFNLTEPLVQGLEQLRLLFPSVPSLQGPEAYLTHYRDFRSQAHRRLEAARVYDSLKAQESWMRQTFLRPDLENRVGSGSLNTLPLLIEALQTPESFVDQDFEDLFLRVETLFAQLEKARPESAANLCLEFRINAENDLDAINSTRDRLIGMLQRGEQHFRALYESTLQPQRPAPALRPPGLTSAH